MNIESFFGNIVGETGKLFGRNERMDKTDLGVLKVAFMVAALDGEVTDAEYAAFDALAKKCRGYTPEGAEAALKDAMHAAGYLMLLSRRTTTDKLVDAFISEAEIALPIGFAYGTPEDVRRAVVTWIAVGMSDGDYSERERACIEALRKYFAELKIEHQDADLARWSGFVTPVAGARTAGPVQIEVIGRDFVSRVEKLVAQYGDSAEAEKELRALIAAAPAV